MKSKIVLGLGNASAATVAAKAATIVSKMTGNTTYPAPTTALTSMTAQIATINAKRTEQQNAYLTYQQKSAELNAERENMLRLIENQAAYVQVASNGDAARILSAGFELRQKPVPNGVLPAPHNVLADAGINDGEVLATWERVRGAKSYIVELSTDVNNPDSWEFQATVTKSRCELNGLESGKRIWVRVAPVNAQGHGGYSDPATRMVP